MDQLFVNIKLFTTSFKEIIIILANTYCTSLPQLFKPVNMANEAFKKRLNQMEVNVYSIIDKILYTPILQPPLLVNNKVLKRKVDQIKNNMESMVRKVL